MSITLRKEKKKLEVSIKWTITCAFTLIDAMYFLYMLTEISRKTFCEHLHNQFKRQHFVLCSLFQIIKKFLFIFSYVSPILIISSDL